MVIKWQYCNFKAIIPKLYQYCTKVGIAEYRSSMDLWNYFVPIQILKKYSSVLLPFHLAIYNHKNNGHICAFHKVCFNTTLPSLCCLQVRFPKRRYVRRWRRRNADFLQCWGRLLIFIHCIIEFLRDHPTTAGRSSLLQPSAEKFFFATILRYSAEKPHFQQQFLFSFCNIAFNIYSLYY